MVAMRVAQLDSVAEQVLGPVRGHVRRRAEPLQTHHYYAGDEGAGLRD